MVLMTLMLFLVTGCTSNVSNYTPETLINNALQETEDQTSFYTKGEMKIFEEDTLTSHVFTEEWHNRDGQFRFENEDIETESQSVMVYDGTKVTLYSVEENEAFIIKDTDSISMNQPSLKEQADVLLDGISETHTVEVMGDENIAGYETHHLRATPKEDNILLGQQDIWIDKKNWMVLKQRIYSGDTKLEIEYDLVNYGQKMADDLFTIDLPDSVTIEDDSDLEGQRVTLKEATSEMAQSILYIPEDEQIDITDLTVQDYDGLKELTFHYQRNDLPFLELIISEVTVGFNEDFKPEDDDVVIIRGKEAYLSDDDIRMVDWDEDGLNYTIFINDPSVSIEDVKQLVEEMINSKE